MSSKVILKTTLLTLQDYLRKRRIKKTARNSTITLSLYDLSL